MKERKNCTSAPAGSPQSRLDRVIMHVYILADLAAIGDGALYDPVLSAGKSPELNQIVALCGAIERIARPLIDEIEEIQDLIEKEASHETDAQAT